MAASERPRLARNFGPARPRWPQLAGRRSRLMRPFDSEARVAGSHHAHTRAAARPGDERELCCCRARSLDLKDLNDLCEIRPSPTKYRFVRGAQQDDSPVQDRTGLSNHNQLSSAGPPSCWRNPGLHLARCRRGRTLSSVLCNSFSHHARCRRRAADHGRHATLDAVLPRARGPHRPVRVIERVKLACN